MIDQIPRQTNGRNKQRSKFRPYLIPSTITLLVVSIIVFVSHGKRFQVLEPKGPIAGEQLNLILFSAAFLLAIAFASLLLLYFFAWKYRESNIKATYSPDMNHGKFFAFSIWALPFAFMLILVGILIPATHRLDPRKQVSSSTKPMTIQVVAMRWKWVFIYPEQHIATVNYVQIPTNTPVAFELSADEAPMSSFWVPNLGGQLYAMTGHVNTLNLLAKEPGEYPGSSAEINGAGFSGMKFVAHADSKEHFDTWVDEVRSSPKILDTAEYNKLLKPSEYNLTAYYAIAQSNLFDNLFIKYNGSNNHMGSMEGMEHK